MLKLDNKDGLIDIGNITISPKLSLSEIEVMSREYKIIRTIVNEGYISYCIPSDDNREFSLYLTFYQGKLYSLNIGLGSKYQYPPWQITDAEIAQLGKELELIGGENDYQWGRVELSVDRKSGSVSILIKYN